MTPILLRVSIESTKCIVCLPTVAYEKASDGLYIYFSAGRKIVTLRVSRTYGDK